MIIEKHIKQIENLLNKEKILKYEVLQVSFDVVCLKFALSNKKNILLNLVSKQTNFSIQ